MNRVIFMISSGLTFSSVSLVPPPRRAILTMGVARRREGYTAVELSR